MNTLGLMLLGSIVHATGFAVVGTLVYLALRRWSPAAGALAAGSSLVIMAFGLDDRSGPLAALVDLRLERIGHRRRQPTAQSKRSIEHGRPANGRRIDSAATDRRTAGGRLERPHRRARFSRDSPRSPASLRAELRRARAATPEPIGAGAGRNGSRSDSSPAWAWAWLGWAWASGPSSVAGAEPADRRPRS